MISLCIIIWIILHLWWFLWLTYTWQRGKENAAYIYVYMYNLYLTSGQLSSCLTPVTCACPAYRKYVGDFSLGRDNEKGCVFTSCNRVDKKLHFDVFIQSYLQIHPPLVTPHQFKKNTHTTILLICSPFNWYRVLTISFTQTIQVKVLCINIDSS